MKKKYKKNLKKIKRNNYNITSTKQESSRGDFPKT